MSDCPDVSGFKCTFLRDSARHCDLNYLALIFPSRLRLINCVVWLPSITASRAAWTLRRVMGKPLEELVVNVNKTSPRVSRCLFVFTLVFFMKTFMFSLSITLKDLLQPGVVLASPVNTSVFSGM